MTFVALLLLAGCASGGAGGPFDQWIDRDVSAHDLRVVQPLRVPATLRDSVIRDRPEGSGGAGDGEQPVDWFIEAALVQNPAIMAAEQRVRRLANRIPQASSLEDPMLQVAPFGDMAETAAGQVDLMLGVSQRFPLTAKLDARRRVAEQDVAAAIQDLEQIKLDVIADVRNAWWNHYDATRAIEVTERSRALVGQIEDNAEAMLRAGRTAQEDVLRASVEAEKLDSELIDLRRRQVNAAAMLNRLCDNPPDRPVHPPAAKSLETTALEFRTLLNDAELSHPALAKVRERIKSFELQAQLARKDRWPDLTVSVNYNAVDDDGLAPSANGDDQWWVGFGINLPIWSDRLDAAEREALRGRLEHAAVLRSELNRIEYEIHDALTRVQTHQRQARQYRDVIVPQQQQAVDAAMSGYRAGSTGFITLIDHWRTLLTLELTYHHHLAELEHSFADLQRAVGHDLPRAPTLDADPENQP